MENRTNHLASIDGLKGAGAFIIAFIWHYLNLTNTSGGAAIRQCF